MADNEENYRRLFKIVVSILIICIVSIIGYVFYRIDSIDTRLLAVEMHTPATNGQVEMLSVRLDERTKRIEERIEALSSMLDQRCDSIEDSISKLNNRR